MIANKACVRCWLEVAEASCGEPHPGEGFDQARSSCQRSPGTGNGAKGCREKTGKESDEMLFRLRGESVP